MVNQSVAPPLAGTAVACPLKVALERSHSLKLSCMH